MAMPARPTTAQTPKRFVESNHQRGQCHHDHVHPEEPQRPGDQLRGREDHVVGHVERIEGDRGHQADAEEHHGGPHHPDQTAVEEGRVAASLADGGPPGAQVGETADEEEERHHLEHPGRQPESTHLLEGVGAGDLSALPDDDGDQPVPEYHHDDAEPPEEVHIAVAIGRGLAGQIEQAHTGSLGRAAVVGIVA